MILILSQAEDKGTNVVIDWIKCDFKRINKENHISNFKSHINSSSYSISNTFETKYTVDIAEITNFWYFRDDFTFSCKSGGIWLRQVQLERDKLKQFLHYIFSIKCSLGSFNKETYHNKLITLLSAMKLGLSIPPTLVTSQKVELIDFKVIHRDIIAKSVDNMFEMEMNNSFQSIGTQIVTEAQIGKLGDTFFPILVQRKIEKAFELRVFFMKDKFYPMAIFSQNDEKTQLDYRNYNREKPNRNIPYLLPTDIQEKLQLLMGKLDLDSGSIDMIVTPEGQYVFLEVNPTGQFGWVSENCNYYLEEKIANYLQGES